MKMQPLFIFILVAIFLSVAFLLGASSSSIEIKIGDKAPIFELYDQNGNLFSLEEYKNTQLVIYFFPRTFTPG
tara:strand:+ start:733 stop:951 length:219 start_codon:yes stop_codon:yes gene_type:complete